MKAIMTRLFAGYLTLLGVAGLVGLLVLVIYFCPWVLPLAGVSYTAYVVGDCIMGLE